VNKKRKHRELWGKKNAQLLVEKKNIPTGRTHKKSHISGEEGANVVARVRVVGEKSLWSGRRGADELPFVDEP